MRRILTALGNVEQGNCRERTPCRSVIAGSTEPEAKENEGTARSPFPTDAMIVTPPSWRRDLSREIDLIEEVARIHGYDKIPEDVSVPMAASSRRREDRVVAKIRNVLTAAGFDEAMTLSAVDEASARAVQAWTQADPLRSRTPVIRGADQSAHQPRAQPAGRAADQRIAFQPRHRIVRGSQDLSLQPRAAGGMVDAGAEQRPALRGSQGSCRGTGRGGQFPARSDRRRNRFAVLGRRCVLPAVVGWPDARLRGAAQRGGPEAG